MKNLKKVVSKIGGVVLGLSMIGSLGQAAYAEGSRDLINSGGNRPQLVTWPILLIAIAADFILRVALQIPLYLL